MAVEIEALELEVVHKSQGASVEIQSLIDRLEKLRSIVSGGAGLKGLASEFGRIGKAIANSSADKMASSLERVVTAAGNASVALQEYVMWAKEAKSLGISLPRSGGSAGASSAVSDSAMSATSAVTDSLVNVQSDAVQVAVDRVNDLGNAMQDTADKAKEMGKSVEKASQHVKNVGKHASKAKGPLASLASSFLRIAKMRMIRAVLRGIITALKEGITNLYHYSQAVNNADPSHAANTMDAYASAILKVKNSIAAALMPIIRAALPLIQSITNAIVTALNAFNRFVSAITGQTAWTFATDASASFADNLGSAAGSAKELKNQLMGFDELNILEEPSGGGGGGGASNATNPGDMFDYAPLDPEYLNRINRLLEPIKTAMERIGKVWDKFAGSKVGSALIDSVKWLEQHAVAEMIERIADSLNYVADVIEIIDMALSPENWSWATFFKDIGDMLATIGESASMPAYLGFSFVNKFIGKLAGKEEGLLSDEWVRTIAELVTPGAGLGTLGRLIGQGAEWIGDDVAKKFREGIMKGWNGKIVDDDGLLKKMGEESGVKGWFERVFVEPIKNGVEKAKSWLEEFWEGVAKGSFAKSASDKLSDFASELLSSVYKAVDGGALNSKAKKSLRTMNSTIRNATKKSSNEFNELSQNIKEGFKGAYDEATGTWKSLNSWMDENAIGPTGKRFEQMTSGMARQMASASNTAYNAWSGKAEWFSSSVTKPTEESFSALGKKISNAMQSSRNDTNNAWLNSGSWFVSNVVNPVGTKMTDLGNTISTKLKGALDATKSTYRTANTWFNDNVKVPVENTFKTLGSSIEKKLEDTFVNAKKRIANTGFVDYITKNVTGTINDKLSGLEATVYVNIRTPTLRWTLKEVDDYGIRSKLNALNIGTTLPQLTVSWYAGGGFVPDGQLFFAGEAGPEMVGRMGSQTAVANQGQIVDGISRGVYDAMMSAMSNGGQNTHITVKVGDGTLADVVTRALNNQTRRLGYSQLEGI